MHNQDDKIAFIDKDKAPKKKKKKKKETCLLCNHLLQKICFFFFSSFAPLKGIDIHTMMYGLTKAKRERGK